MSSYWECPTCNGIVRGFFELADHMATCDGGEPPALPENFPGKKWFETALKEQAAFIARRPIACSCGLADCPLCLGMF